MKSSQSSSFSSYSKEWTTIEDFEIIKPISRGAFRRVFLARKRATGDVFAIKIQEVLVKFIENAVRFDQQSNAVYVKNKMDVNDVKGVELCTVLKAMDVVGILDYGLAKVADLMMKHVIAPAVRSGSHSFAVEEQRSDSGYIADVALRITPPSGTQIDRTMEKGKKFSDLAAKRLYARKGAQSKISILGSFSRSLAHWRQPKKFDV